MDLSPLEHTWKVGDRTITAWVDWSKKSVEYKWRPNNPLMTKWLPKDQLAQLEAGRHEFFRMIKERTGVEPEMLGSPEFSMSRWKDIMR